MNLRFDELRRLSWRKEGRCESWRWVGMRMEMEMERKMEREGKI